MWCERRRLPTSRSIIMVTGALPSRFGLHPANKPHWLDLPVVDWSEVQEIMMEAFRLAAPKRLASF